MFSSRAPLSNWGDFDEYFGKSWKLTHGEFSPILFLNRQTSTLSLSRLEMFGCSSSVLVWREMWSVVRFFLWGLFDYILDFTRKEVQLCSKVWQREAAENDDNKITIVISKAEYMRKFATIRKRTKQIIFSVKFLRMEKC